MFKKHSGFILNLFPTWKNWVGASSAIEKQHCVPPSLWCHVSSDPVLAGMGLGGGGGNCKGSDVEIADGEQGSGDGRGGERKGAWRKGCHICSEKTAKSESRDDFIGGAPSTAINPGILQENCKCSLQKLSTHCS